MIKVRYVWENSKEIDFYNGNEYDCIGISEKLQWLKVIDESKEDYCYQPELFDIVDKEKSEKEDKELFDKVNKLIEQKKHKREKW